MTKRCEERSTMHTQKIRKIRGSFFEKIGKPETNDNADAVGPTGNLLSLSGWISKEVF